MSNALPLSLFGGRFLLPYKHMFYIIKLEGAFPNLFRKGGDSVESFDFEQFFGHIEKLSYLFALVSDTWFFIDKIKNLLKK